MVDESINILLGLTTICVAKHVGAILWRRKKFANFEYVGNVSAINLYPVKSTAPISLQSAQCTKHGLCSEGIHDRHWMVVRGDGLRMNINQQPKMALIKTTALQNVFCLDAPGMPTLELEKYPSEDPSRFINCKVVGMSIVGMDCGKTASDWICQYLGMDDLIVVVSTEGMTKRTISDNDNPWINAPFKDDQVTFSDFGVCNITSESSLQDLNNRLTNPVAMGNFRPSIVVKGSVAFDEDFWKEVKIGDDVYMRLLEPCPRCLTIAVDPKGKRDPSTEPIKTLRRFRKSPLYGDAPLFGVTTAVDSEGMIKVGDPVYVLR